MLKANHVSKIYEDGTKAITDINLHVQSGDIYGFIGANGAGKSTLIKSIVGIHPFNEGEISIDGYSMKMTLFFVRKEWLISQILQTFMSI